MAHEQVTLYGVPLVADRLVNYGKVDPELSRELFIRHALVYGEWHTQHRFFARTASCSSRPRSSSTAPAAATSSSTSTPSSTSTTPGSVAEVVSGAHFDQWWKQERRERPDLLTFDPAMLTHDDRGARCAIRLPRGVASGRRRADVPDQLPLRARRRRRRPDHRRPVATLNRVAADDFSWNVPGLREELVTGLIRSLPKNLRVNFVPAPNKAREFLAAVPPGEEPLLDALERWCGPPPASSCPRDAWDWTKVPEHLRPTYRVVDDDGARAGPGQGPGGAQGAAAAAVRGGDGGGRRPTAGSPHRRDRRGCSATSRRRSPGPAPATRSAVSPALVDEGATVGLQVFGSEDERDARHRLGVARLLLLALPAAGPAIVRASTTPRSSGSPGRRTPRSPTCSRTAGPPWSARRSTRPAVRTRRRTTPCWPAASRLEARLRELVALVLRVLDGWRAADRLLERPGRHDRCCPP